MPHPLHMFYGNLVQLGKNANSVIRSSHAFVKNIFSEEVQNILQEMGCESEATWCCLLSKWYSAVDDAGVPINTRTKRLLEMRDELPCYLKVGHFPPPGKLRRQTLTRIKNMRIFVNRDKISLWKFCLTFSICESREYTTCLRVRHLCCWFCHRIFTTVAFVFENYLYFHFIFYYYLLYIPSMSISMSFQNLLFQSLIRAF